MKPNNFFHVTSLFLSILFVLVHLYRNKVWWITRKIKSNSYFHQYENDKCTVSPPVSRCCLPHHHPHKQSVLSILIRTCSLQPPPNAEITKNCPGFGDFVNVRLYKFVMIVLHWRVPSVKLDSAFHLQQGVVRVCLGCVLIQFKCKITI